MSSRLLASFVVLAVLIAAAPARAETELIAVAPFAGPEVVASEARAVVVEVVGARYPVVPAARLEQARALAETDGSEPAAALAMARMAGADAVVVGEVAAAGEAYALSLSVLRAADGESVGAVLVPLATAEMTPAARARIARLLGDLLVWIEPDRTHDGPPGRSAPQPQLRAEAQGQVDIADRDVSKARPDAARKQARPERRFPLVFQAAVGLSATARRLAFSQEAGLAGDASLSANPSPGLHVEAEASTPGEPAIGVAVSIDRSVNAGMSLGGSQGVELPVTQMEWGGALRGRIRVKKRWVPTFQLGYSELRYEVGIRPPGLMVPDARYAFVDAGGGVRYELGRATVFGAGSYLLTIATSGITDQAAFGAAGSYGLRGEVGLEVELLERILVRVAARYMRFVLDFEGSGDLAVALDEDLDQDVIGAVDAFIGATAQAVFRF
jgi:hypothetical protein